MYLAKTNSRLRTLDRQLASAISRASLWFASIHNRRSLIERQWSTNYDRLTFYKEGAGKTAFLALPSVQVASQWKRLLRTVKFAVRDRALDWRDPATQAIVCDRVSS